MLPQEIKLSFLVSFSITDFSHFITRRKIRISSVVIVLTSDVTFLVIDRMCLTYVVLRICYRDSFGVFTCELFCL